jgi:hypothetical protein
LKKKRSRLTGWLRGLILISVPPQPVTGDDIYVRAMYIVSDQINSYGGRFPIEEHPRLMELLIDSPVLIGHRKDTLPIARNFYAEPVVRDGVNWIKVYFYWLKSAVDAEDLRCNIDGGIYKECSISFIFSFPECSICGEDMRQCRHRPFAQYSTEAGEKQVAHFNYRRIEKVLETSLVYRGAIDDTALTKELVFQPEKAEGDDSIEESAPLSLPPVRRIWDLEYPGKQNYCLVMPAYESLSVILCRDEKGTKLLDAIGREISGDIIKAFLSNLIFPEGSYAMSARLIGYRGKERQQVAEVLKHICGKKATVRRLEIKICDILAKDSESLQFNTESRRKLLEELFISNPELIISAVRATENELDKVVRQVATRYGAEIILSDSAAPLLYTHRKLLAAKVVGKSQKRERDKYLLSCNIDGVTITTAEPIGSLIELDEGDSAEIEIYSLYRNGEEIKLIHPQIIDRLADNGESINIIRSQPPVSDKKYSGSYNLHMMPDGRLCCTIKDNAECLSFVIHHFAPELLASGRRFLADNIIDTNDAGSDWGSGGINNLERNGSFIRFRLDGSLSGHFQLLPAVLKANKHYLFHKLDCDRNGGE